MIPRIKEDFFGDFSTPLIERTKEYVAGFIGEHFTEKICYHNIDHTLEVVHASELIGRQCDISDSDLETVIIAAWFHDTGYYLGCESHEEASASIARDYLRRENIDERRVKSIDSCILATMIPQNPQNLLDQILCDADLYHLSTDHYFEKSDLLLRELSFEGNDYSQESWMKLSREFIEAHRYHTPYGKRVLFPLLKKNLELLNSRINEFEP